MNNSKLLKAGVWYTVSTFFVKSISVITTPLFTRILTKDEIGVFSVALTWINILTVILSLNLYETVILARYDYKDDREYKEYLSTIAILGTLVGGIFYIFVFSIKNFAVAFTGIPLYAIHIVLVYVVFSPCISIVLAKYRAEMQYGRTVVVSLISALSSSIISIILVLCWDDKLKGRFFGTYLPEILINLILFFSLTLEGRSFKLFYCRYALPLGLPLIIHHLSGSLMRFSDRIMIQKMCGNEEVAIYTLAYTCAMFADIMRNSLNSAWDPWIFEKLNSKKTDDIKVYSKYYLIFFVMICIYIMLFAPELLLIFGGSSYLEARFAIPPVVVGYLFCMVYSLFSCLERFAKQQKRFALITLICATVNIALNFAFIPLFGYIAAAYTTLLGYMLSGTLHYFNAKKIGLAGVYDIRMILRILGVAIGISGIILISYSMPALRIILILVITIGCFFFIVHERERMIKVVRAIKSK